MRNKPYRSKENINRDGIITLVFGFITWIVMMLLLGIF